MIVRLLLIYILQWDQNWQRETSFGCQNWSDQTDFGSKSDPGGPILAKFFAKIGLARLILGGPILVRMTGVSWNLFHQKLAEILSWHGLQTEEKTIVFLTCRYHAWRFPNTYSHIATIQSLAIVGIASHIAQPTYVSASHFWSIGKWLACKMTWLREYLNTELNFPQFCHISVYITYK